MEWRIREAQDGSFHAEYGGYIQSGIEAGFKPGFYMPGFHVSESSRFDTRKQAEEYIKCKEKMRCKSHSFHLDTNPQRNYNF